MELRSPTTGVVRPEASMSMTAISSEGSVPTTVALNERPSMRVTVIERASLRGSEAVITWPSARIINPVVIVTTTGPSIVICTTAGESDASTSSERSWDAGPLATAVPSRVASPEWNVPNAAIPVPVAITTRRMNAVSPEREKRRLRAEVGECGPSTSEG